MKYLIGLVLSMLLLVGCANPGGNRNLTEDQVTNNVALTNLNLGIEYMRAGNLESALEKLNRAQEADPSYSATHNALGLLYQRLGDPALAERHFKRAIALNNNDSLSKNNYGNFLCQIRRFDEADAILRSAAENPLYETPELAYTNAGTCAMMNKKLDAAEKYFRQALSINPQVASALIQMAQLSYDQANYLNARGYLQRYQSIAKYTAASLALGIKIEQQLGDHNAVSSYQMLLKNNFGDSVEASKLNKPAGA